MKDLIGKSIDWSLEQMDKPDNDEIKKEIALKIGARAVPQNVDITTLGDKIVQEIPLSQAEKELYAKLRLGLLAQSVSADTKGISGSVGSGQPDEKRESGIAGV